MNWITRFRNVFAAENMPRSAGKETAWADDYGIYYSSTPYYNPDELVTKKGFNIYAKMMTDEQVKSVVRFRRAAITSRSYDFEFTDDVTEQLSAEEQDFRKSLFWAVLRKQPGSFVDSLNGILSAVYNGFSLTEKVYQLFEYDGKQWVGIKKLALRPANTFDLYSDNFGNLIKLVQRVSSGELILDHKKFIHYVHSPDVNDLYGQSELRAAYRAWFSKDIAIRNQNIFGQRLAGGFVWTETDENYSIVPGSQEETSFRNTISNIQTKSSIILPRGVTLHIEMPKSSNFFENKIAQEDKAIAKALLVPNLLGITEQGNTGSYSQSQTQFEAFMWTLDSEVTKLEEIVNEQLFSELGDINFGDGLYPQFTFKPLSQTEKAEIAKVWLSMVEGKVITHSDTDEDWIRDMLGGPARVEGETIGDDTAQDIQDKSNDNEENLPDDETIIGKEIQNISILSRAVRRVDFAAIDRKADIITYQRGDELSSAVDDAISAVMDKLTEDVDPKVVAKLVVPSSKLKKIQDIVRATLRDSWDVGKQQSMIEVRRAERQAERQFNRHIKMARLDEMAAKYFDAQSFAIAGDISSQATKIIQNEVLNGIRYSKSTADIRNAIYERLASAGLISEATADAANVGLNIKNSKHTIDTIVRTSSFMSINEARHSYYTDPALEGFVRAFEYSSILDSRTTEICNELGGSATGKPHVHSADWPGWDRFRPPNHYNCRALLIPITELDEWTESPEPTVEPQEGFG